MKLTNFKICYSFFIPVILVHLCLLNEEEASVIEKILKEQECACWGAFPLSITNNGSLVETGHKYPWTIALLNNNIAICGGALITKDIAITAAHCLLRFGVLKHLGGGQCLISKKPQNCFETTGNLLAGFMHDHEPKIGRRICINRYYIHPQYTPLESVNDIALLHLATPSDCNYFNRPICLSFQQEDIKPGTSVKIAGWGSDILNESPYNEPNKPYVHVLKEVELKLWTIESCEKENGHNDPNTFCATGKREGVCNGDSGSVAFLQNPERVYYAVGIASTLLGNVCQHSTPASFTKILAYKCWIEDIVQKESSSG